MKLLSIQSAVPPTILTQQQCWDQLRQANALSPLRPGSRTLLEKFLLNDNGIQTRHLAMHDMEVLATADAGALNQIYEKEVTALGTASLSKALDQAALKASDIDALFVCSCTGYLCPGPASHIAEVSGMKENVYLFDLVGQGCGAAIPMLHAATSYLKQHPTHRVACIAVEICSAAFYVDNDPGVLVSLALFGDGASASIWQGCETSSDSGYELSQFQTLHLPEARDTLRFINSGGYLKNQLHRSVPETVGKAVAKLYREIPEPAHVISHGGGRDVLDAVESATGDRELSESRQTLQRYGNMSSPSVLFALQQHLESDNPVDDLWLVSFGAGFTCHAARMKSS